MARILTLALLALAACNTAPVSTPGGITVKTPIGSAAAAEVAGSVRAVGISEFKADRDAGKVPVLFDVRTPGEYSEGHVEGAILVPLQELDRRMADFEAHRDGEIYLICRSGGRSARAASTLAAAGYSTVNVEGGTMAWMAAGHPVAR